MASPPAEPARLAVMVNPRLRRLLVQCWKKTGSATTVLELSPIEVDRTKSLSFCFCKHLYPISEAS